jgi:two-component system, LuxR family, response regulator FixJ
MGTPLEEISMPVPRIYQPPEPTPELICIVDDDEWVADSLKLLLETFGFAVRLYNSGSEFLADDRGRTTSCLVIDQHMPGMDGLDVVDHVQKEGIRVPTILISGRLDASARDRASRLGVTRVVEKPFVAARLVDLIRASLMERN